MVVFLNRFGRASRGGGAWRGYHPSTLFDGEIDDITLWTVPLPTQQIFQLMYHTRSLTGKERGLSGCWGFNEEDATDRSVYDCSQHANHGEIVGHTVARRFAMSKPLNDISMLER